VITELNLAHLLIACLPVFVIAYFLYGRFIGRVFGEDRHRKTPAREMEDGKDYVPANPLVLFSHHFASIAGGGPVVGPAVALVFGYGPAWFWIVLGAVFIGAVHDFSSLFVSIREGGKSIAEVAERYLGRRGFILFISFAVVYILLVTSAFLQMTATALTSLVPVESLNLQGTETLLKTTVSEGKTFVWIGGIASTSVIFITCLAPLLGWLLYRKSLRASLAAVFAVAVAVGSIRIGLMYPVNIGPSTWMLILAVYVFFASGIPVWIILQPRDFTNSFILFGGIIGLVTATIVGGLKGMTLSAPSFDLASGQNALGSLWPFLFITIACGAISGFHALVASGTTSKQISNETHARKIGYGGMLLEGVLAVCVVTAIAGGIKFATYKSIVFPDVGSSNPILGFAMGMGGLLHRSLGINQAYGTLFGILMVEGFVVTTLDTAVRLNRYLFEGLWKSAFRKPPRILGSYYFNSLLCVVLMLILAKTNAFLSIWPIFGTANQLLAALTLTCVTVWLMRKRKPFMFALLPAGFMIVTTTASLLKLLFTKYLPQRNITLTIADVLLLGLSIAFVILAVSFIRKKGDEQHEPARSEVA
jgi:carbon starvation protein